MTNDLTLLYYTANQIADTFAERVRAHLLKSSGGDIPIISISQKPVSLGINICLDDIGVSFYNVCKQILVGCHAAKTEYVACCEDDTLYTPEHFAYRPPPDTFAYNMHWTLGQDGMFWYRGRTGMLACIAPRHAMIEAMDERFAKFPFYLGRYETIGWGEPGRCEERLGLTPRKMIYFNTEDAPIVTFNHRPSLGGVRRNNPSDIFRDDIFPWGNGRQLLEAFRDG